jgi:hypothetical protein
MVVHSALRMFIWQDSHKNNHQAGARIYVVIVVHSLATFCGLGFVMHNSTSHLFIGLVRSEFRKEM